ncbi:MAG TPA: hypothetical protein VIT93_00890 [Dehalococcoidia bacterium]
MGILKTLRRQRLRIRGRHLAGSIAGVAAVALLAILLLGPVDVPAESRDLCRGDAIVPTPPKIAMSTPDYDPSKDPVPTLPAGTVQLPAFDPNQPESRPALPSGWIWDGNEPRPVDRGGGLTTTRTLDGKLIFTIFPESEVVSWDDPDRPEGLPWYDPTIEDPCR